MMHPTDYPSFTVCIVPHHTMVKIAERVTCGPNSLPNPGSVLEDHVQKRARTEFQDARGPQR